MSLSLEQRAARRGKMTASRVAVLMTADAEGIMRLYQEMIGELLEEDLSNVWAVQLGAATESLNLDWYAKKFRHAVTRRGEVWTNDVLDWMAATLDGWDADDRHPIECKHVGGFEPLEVLVDRYQPQCQWQMLVTGALQCALSVIMGAREPIVEFIKADPDYQQEMLDRADYFMMCVALRQPPVKIAEPVEPPGEPDAVIDMRGNNAWTDYAMSFMENEDAADRYEEAKKGLKGLVPENAKRCFGAGIRVTRDRAGRLHIRRDV